MNLTEGKVEWCGNGVVLIRERSVAQTVWRFCVHVERQLYWMIQRSVGLVKSLCQKCLSFMVGAVESTPKNMASEKQSSVSRQAQSRIHEPVASRVNKHQLMAKMRPAGTLTEIRRYAASGDTAVVNSDEQTDLQQLLPAMAGFCRDRWLVLVSPPQRPGLAELIKAGIDPSRVLLVHARDSQIRDGAGFNNADLNNTGLNNTGLNNRALKIVEQALQSGTCGAVVAWLEDCDAPALQRLRGAAVAGHAWGVMFRAAE